MTRSISRRSLLKAAACSSIALATPFAFPVANLFADVPDKRFYIGICDWNLPGCSVNPKAFALAKELGFEGVQISCQPFSEMSFEKNENAKLYLDEAEKTKMSIPSACLGIMNERPFASEADAETWVSKCMTGMAKMKVKRVLIPFFGKGEIRDKPIEQKSIIEKFRRLSPEAEKLGIQLLIESYLSGEDHARMIDAVGSNAIKVYFDPQNMANAGHDVIKDIEFLGKKKLIAEMHLKDNGHRLKTSPLDYPKIKETLLQIDYTGWLVVEGSVSGDWKESQSENASYAKELFSAK